MKIKDFEEYEVTGCGKVINTRTGRVLKPNITKYGYERVTLSQNSKIKRFYVHRLVALHFLPNPLFRNMVNHKNGYKRDNSVENLEWCTCKENTIHAFDTGLRASGEKGAHAKLTNKQVHSLCLWLSKGLTRGEILSKEEFKNVTKTMFDDIRRRKSWKSISKNYSWRKSNDYPEREYS